MNEQNWKEPLRNLGKFTQVPEPLLTVAEAARVLVRKSRKLYAQQFGLPLDRAHRLLPAPFVEQLDRCIDDEARRILFRARWEVAVKAKASRKKA